MSKAVQHLQSINVQDEYGTPKEKFEQACKKYNIQPTIDICASKSNHVLENYCDIELNCFEHEYNEDFFMNPPYSKVSEFMQFAFEQHRKYNVSVLILVYSKTDTKWWHKYVEDIAEVHNIEGRIKFLDQYGNIPSRCNTCKENFSGLKFCPKCGKKTSENSAPYPSCWIIFRHTDKICNSCESNFLFENQITCESCHENCKSEGLE